MNAESLYEALEWFKDLLHQGPWHGFVVQQICNFYDQHTIMTDIATTNYIDNIWPY